MIPNLNESKVWSGGSAMQKLKSVNKPRILYTLLFFLFCIIDQRVKTASGLDGTYEFFRNLMGVVMALLILSSYEAAAVRQLKLPFLIWTISGLILGAAAFVWGISHVFFLPAWFLLLLSVFLFGYILIYTVIILLKGKRLPALNRPMLAIWGVLMLLMTFSRSNYLWPPAYLLMFGFFFLTPRTKIQQEDLFHGLLNGVILSFFVFQAYCCVFRPYDVVRYVGIYTNSNIAGLYYLEVLAAFMAKYLDAVRKKAGILIKVFCWLGLGVTISFLFMCIGRTAWIVAFILCIVFLLALNKQLCKKRFFRNGLALVVCAGILFPVTFGIVRYTPPFFHHPVWFFGEWSEEKVHSWDPWNSEKYIDMDELLSTAVGRLAKTLEDLLNKSPFAISAKAAEADPVDRREEMAVLSYEEAENGLLVRKTIYSHYFRNLNLWGHRQDEQGFQLTGKYWIGHAHNIYLQYGTDFGIIALLFFIGLSFWVCVSLIGDFRKKENPEFLGYFLFALIPLAFGLLEYCWGVGTFSILTLFMAWGRAIRRD